MSLSELLNNKSRLVLFSIKCLVKLNNKPLTTNEISKILENEENITVKNLASIVSRALGRYTINNESSKAKNPFFIREGNPFKYKILPEIFELIMKSDVEDIERPSIGNKKLIAHLKNVLDTRSNNVVLAVKYFLLNNNNPANVDTIHDGISKEGTTKKGSLGEYLYEYSVKPSRHTYSKNKKGYIYFVRNSKKPFTYKLNDETYLRLLNDISIKIEINNQKNKLEINSINEIITNDEPKSKEIRNLFLEKKDKIKSLKQNFVKVDSNIFDDDFLDEELEYELGELEDELGEELYETFEETIQNPLNQAICILGDTGSGKTFTTKNVLQNENHIVLNQILDDNQEHILYEYLPHEQKYVLSIIGNFILKANSNRNLLYTIVFDECHKYLDRINNSLLQCLSLKRNGGDRFIQNDLRINNLFSELEDSYFGKKIPDNLGFIFISSKPENIEANEDFKNRLDFYEIRKDFNNENFSLNYLKSNEYTFEDNRW